MRNRFGQGLTCDRGESLYQQNSAKVCFFGKVYLFGKRLKIDTTGTDTDCIEVRVGI
jgi:hypothetical protein